MENLLQFIKRFNYIFLFVLLEIVAILLIVQNSYYQSSLIVRWTNGIAGWFNNGVDGVTGYFGLKSENDRLAEENAALRAQLASSYIQYSKETFTVNDTVYKQRYSYTEAQVIKNSRNGHANYIMINKGSDQGIHTDQAVISPEGIVGVVVSTTRNFATIMPVIHPDSRNSVKLRRINTNGSLIWEGGDYRYATVTDIPLTHTLYKNDTIVTSGFAHDFPEGIPVGYVDKIKPSDGSGFYIVKVRLATDFSNLDHVYIVDNNFKAEQDELESQINNE